MKTKYLSLLAFAVLSTACSTNDEGNNLIPTQENKVLLLKVDYTTNTFEGGKELTFDENTDSFTLETEYVEPGDFGSIQLHYQELNTKLFDGTIVWDGTGSISFPESFDAASSFEAVLTNDYVFPTEGFNNVFNPNNETYNYQTIWSSVQSLVKTREYLLSNPDAKANIFLYTPSVGFGNPEEWDWIIILKN